MTGANTPLPERLRPFFQTRPDGPDPHFHTWPELLTFLEQPEHERSRHDLTRVLPKLIRREAGQA